MMDYFNELVYIIDIISKKSWMTLKTIVMYET